jgi:hypothetical protein
MTYGELGKTCAEIASLVSMLATCDKDEKALADKIKADIGKHLARVKLHLDVAGPGV